MIWLDFVLDGQFVTFLVHIAFYLSQAILSTHMLHARQLSSHQNLHVESISFHYLHINLMYLQKLSLQYSINLEI